MTGMRLHHFVGSGVALLVAACGGSTVIDGSAGGASSSSAGQGGASSPASTSSSGGCTSFVSCCDDVTGEPVDYQCDANGMPFCPSGSSFSEDGTCGGGSLCLDAFACDVGAWCDFPDNLCGAGQPGTCRGVPQGCNDLFRPTCRCDGVIAANPCEGQSAGFDASENGACVPPLDTFACGDTFCGVGAAYCQRGVSDVGGEPDSYACVPAPNACTAGIDCACLAMEPCGFSCSDAGGGEVTLTCPGG